MFVIWSIGYFNMKIIFFGTSQFAIPSLEAVSLTAHSLLAVVTQPDKRGGRTHRLLESPVKRWALENKIPLLQPPDLSESSFMAALKKNRADLFVVVSYGKILPPALLALPSFGGVNVHPSLLPRYRGANPIPWAILNGDPKTGVTLIRLVEEVDAGDILLQKEVALDQEEDALQLSEKLSRLGGKLLVESLDGIEKGKATFVPQRGEVSDAPRFKKEDGAIDWTKSAKMLSREIRAFVPWPGSFSYLDGKRLLIWKAKEVEGEATGCPGEVVGFSGEKEFIVATGKGKLLVERLQLEGKEMMSSSSFLAGHPLRIGETFACNP